MSVTEIEIQKLIEEIHTTDESKLNDLIVNRAIELGVSEKALTRQASNAYYERYERGQGPKVDPRACEGINVR